MPFWPTAIVQGGEAIVRVGETGPGIALVLSGEIEATQRDQAGKRASSSPTSRGNFMGELAQLSGRPYLVDEIAVADTEIMAIAPDRLRALLIAEAYLGERIMRALILRRVGLLETGAGPIIIGEEGDRTCSGSPISCAAMVTAPAARPEQ